MVGGEIPLVGKFDLRSAADSAGGDFKSGTFPVDVAFDLSATDSVCVFTAIGHIFVIAGVIALRAVDLGLDLDPRLLMIDFRNHRLRGRRVAEVALGDDQVPGTGKVRLRIGRHRGEGEKASKSRILRRI